MLTLAHVFCSLLMKFKILKSSVHFLYVCAEHTQKRKTKSQKGIKSATLLLLHLPRLKRRNAIQRF